VKFITHLPLMPRSRIRGSIHGIVPNQLSTGKSSPYLYGCGVNLAYDFVSDGHEFILVAL
jgi:hypothetical protein